MVARGYAMPIQARPSQGYIVYEFIDGTYDGVKMRLYPPFVRRVTFGGETYVWGPPRNGRSKRLTYRLEGCRGDDPTSAADDANRSADTLGP